MQYINQHHKVFQDSTENDFGIDYILGASTSADCWIHIRNGKDRNCWVCNQCILQNQLSES